MKTWLISISLLIVGTALTFQNCAQQSFVGYTPEEKSSKLGEPVNCTGAGCEVDVDVPGRTNPDEDGVTMWPTDPTDYCTEGGGCTPNDDFPIRYFVSNWMSSYHGNVATNNSFLFSLQNRQDVTVCSFVDSTFKASILAGKKFKWSLIAAGCPSLADGSYRLRIRGNDVLKNDRFGNNRKKDLLSPMPEFPLASEEQAIRTPQYGSYVDDFQGLIIRKLAGKWYRNEAAPLVLMDNPNATNPALASPALGIIPDQKASPLLIQLGANTHNPEKLVFSAVTRGILFDILGVNAKPAAHTKKRISWHKSMDYLYVALPDANGQVNGIDQLFGDNTQGVDGKFSANGFMALAKFDSNKDGYITKSDAVFAKLRFWRDANTDGVAQAAELLAARALGINLIDLNYDAKYFEIDRHGNETRFKSVVQTDDGKIHLMFDVWFNYLD